jgi:hypothetical protein
MTQHELVITATSEMLAVEQLLSDTVLRGRQEHAHAKGFLVGYNVEGPDLTALIARAIEEIGALAAEQRARIVACEVSGLHMTDEGHRLWGTIECVTTPGEGNEATRVDSIRLEQSTPGLWRLTATTTSKESS